MSADEQPTGWPDGLMRLLSITWPKPKTVPPHPLEIRLHEHGTNEPIESATGIVIVADVSNAPITARLTMLVDEDRLPLLGRDISRATLDDNGEPRTGQFTWVVAEMRIADE